MGWQRQVTHVHVWRYCSLLEGKPLASLRLLMLGRSTGTAHAKHMTGKVSPPGKVLDTCSSTHQSINVHRWELRGQSAVSLPERSRTSTEVICVQVASQNKARAQDLALQEAAACAASGRQAVVLQVRSGSGRACLILNVESGSGPAWLLEVKSIPMPARPVGRHVAGQSDRYQGCTSASGT